MIQAGVQSGDWTYEEGLIQSLEALTGQRAASELAGGGRVRRSEGTSLLRAALHYLEHGEDEEAKERLRAVMRPFTLTEEKVAPYSIPADPAALGLARRVPAERLAAADPATCRNSWLEGFSGEADETFTCLVYQETAVPLDNSGEVTVRVYLPIHWQDDSDKQPYFETALAAAVDSLETYDAFDTVDDTTLYFTPLDDPEDVTTLMSTYIGFTAALGENCPIYIHPSSVGGDQDEFAQIVAHEVFHCFQYWNLHAQSDNPHPEDNEWWVEGSADYFSNVVKPCVNYEHGQHKYFSELSREVWLFDMEYETSIFFQYLANQGGPEAVLAVLEAMPTSGGKQAQARALKSAGVEEQSFHQFGRAYLDGFIQDPCGGPIPAEGKIHTNETFRPDPPGQFGPESLLAKPYTLARYALIVPQEARYLLELTEQSGQGTTGTKSREAPGQWGELPDDVRTSCDSGETFLTLLTTTELDGADYELNLKGEGERAQCDGCLLGTWQVDRDEFRGYMQRALNQTDNEAVEFQVEDVHGRLLVGFDGQGQMRGVSQDFGLTLSLESAAMAGSLLSIDMNIGLSGEGTYAADGEVLTLYNPQVNAREEGLAQLFDGSTQEVNLELTLAEIFGLANAFGADVGPPPSQTERPYQCFDDEGRLLFDLDDLGSVEYTRSDENVFEDR